MSYKVTVRPSGREFTVEDDETILAAALRSGVGLPYGCKNGACGTCKAKGLEGEWVQGPHSSSALSGDEQASRKLLVCCSRPQTDLVIEARELSGFGDIPIRKMPCRIAAIERPVPDVAIVALQLPASERLQFRAGQYLEFILREVRLSDHRRCDLERRIEDPCHGRHADARVETRNRTRSVDPQKIELLDHLSTRPSARTPLGHLERHACEPDPIVRLSGRPTREHQSKCNRFEPWHRFAKDRQSVREGVLVDLLLHSSESLIQSIQSFALGDHFFVDVLLDPPDP
jgi:ferredoxin